MNPMDVLYLRWLPLVWGFLWVRVLFCELLSVTDEESVAQEAVPSSAIEQPPENIRPQSSFGCGREKGRL